MEQAHRLLLSQIPYLDTSLTKLSTSHNMQCMTMLTRWFWSSTCFRLAHMVQMRLRVVCKLLIPRSSRSYTFVRLASHALQAV
jgi:hypothetical protein